jgi:mRNA interferase MazF
MTNFRRGDVVLVLFPDSNLRTAKRRPAVVVQANGLTTELEQTVVAMITSNMTRAGYSCRVPILAGTQNARRSGLLMDSVVMADNLATVQESEIDRVIGTIIDTTELDAALRAALAV